MYFSVVDCASSLAMLNKIACPHVKIFCEMQQGTIYFEELIPNASERRSQSLGNQLICSQFVPM